MMKPLFFKTPEDFRAWLEKHHADTPELWVGFYKKASGKGGITYHEGVDCALCFGWIDGVKKRVDDVSYVHRFTPRRAGSIWSNVNMKRATALAFFSAQPPGYQKLATGWIMQAKREETQCRRLQIIMDASAKGTRTRWM